MEQALHSPSLHAEVQQTPSTQYPLSHCAAVEQGAPFSNRSLVYTTALPVLAPSRIGGPGAHVSVAGS